MRTYIVRFNDKRINPFLLTGSTVRIKNDIEEVEGKYQNRAMPNTKTVVGVRKEYPSNKPLIKISQEDLDKVVPYFNLIDTNKDERITTAKVDFGIDPFWNHPDLFLEIDNMGKELSVSNDPTESPIDFFWFKMMKGDPDYFVDDGSEPRPEVISEVKFIVTPKYKEQTTIKQEYTSLTDSRDTIRAIIKMSRGRKMHIIDQIGDNLYDSKISTDQDLEDIILANLDKSRDKRIENGMKFGDFVEAIAKQSEDQFSITQTVSYAMAKGIIVKSGDMYYFDNMSCGNTPKEVNDYFVKAENNKAMVALELKVNALKKNK